jgi:hypothetical protein
MSLYQKNRFVTGKEDKELWRTLVLVVEGGGTAN